MRQLLLTLGHNSSAVLVEDGEVLCGYETERVTGVKSDSQFPAKAIEEIAKFYGQGSADTAVDMAYVTHWAPTGVLSDMSAKHWQPEAFDGIPIRTLSTDVSHHDTHMAAALAYAGKDFPFDDHTYGIVVDGFGTCGEHFSVYDLYGGKPRLIQRTHGYETSLGLWYQYATAFLGLKMHEDEYKLLGYEAHVDFHMAELLADEAFQTADEWVKRMDGSIYGSKFDPLYDVRALENVRANVYRMLNAVCAKFKLEPNSFAGKCCVAFYVQSVLEQVVLRMVKRFSMNQVILSGGCFYNVKLNKRILDSVDGKVCVYPLAGDQGNAIGLYAMDHPEFEFPSDLFWGKRELKDVGHVPNLLVFSNPEAAEEWIAEKLEQVGYVNLVRGAMEFGPRALCNTTTLALPTKANVQAINAANERNTVMPMAPVMLRQQYERLFERTNQVWKSEQHMILAMEYKEHPEDHEMGICHAYHWPHNYQTGRPQVISKDDDTMVNLLSAFGPLINTSFNFHGHPIALGMASIIENHMMQLKRDPNIYTAVISNA